MARTPSIRQQMTVIASQPREGRVMRTGVWRYGQQNIAALVGDLLPWIYPWLDHFEHWHRWSARRALLRYAIPLGRRYAWQADYLASARRNLQGGCQAVAKTAEEMKNRRKFGREQLVWK